MKKMIDDDDDVDDLAGMNVNNNNQVMPTSRYGGQQSNIPKPQQPANT